MLFKSILWFILIISMATAKDHFKSIDTNNTIWNLSAIDVSMNMDKNQTLLWFGKYLGDLVYKGDNNITTMELLWSHHKFLGSADKLLVEPIEVKATTSGRFIVTLQFPSMTIKEVKEKIVGKIIQPAYCVVKANPYLVKNVSGVPTVYLQTLNLVMGDEFKIKFIQPTQGYIHGENHCFYFETPKGWVMSNDMGKRQDIPMVFFPEKSSWENAPAVAYARSSIYFDTSRKEQTRAMVERTLKDFKNNGSPNSKATYIKDVKSSSGNKGELWKFTGDQWGSIELVAYFVTKKSINFFVFNARNKEAYLKEKDHFIKLVESYREGSDCKPCTGC